MTSIFMRKDGKYYLNERVSGKPKLTYLGTKLPIRLPKSKWTGLPEDIIAQLKRKRQQSIIRRDHTKSTLQKYPYGNGIITGDYTKLSKLLPDNSVDLFFTDPPYPKDSINLYGEVAKLAQQKLKPGGLCIVYTPHAHLAEIITLMIRYLDYWWIFGVYQTGPEARIWVKRLWVGWKPILAFSKRPSNGRLTDTWFKDWFRGAGEDKRFHDWGQEIREAAYWIETLCPKHGLVVDPFCGGGTIPLAAKLSKRKWLAVEVNKKTAAIARKRVSHGTHNN